jgi:hypothetical protein
MPDRLLKLKDKGAEVAEAQGLLNRDGAILDPDGDFGNGTETAVREFQAARRLPVSGAIDDATWRALRGLPDPSPDIPTRAVAFIAREEVGSRKLYDTRWAQPTWPGGDSGVTIGVGYDLGYQTDFAADWSDHLSEEQIAALRPWIGIKGVAAQAGPPELTTVTIPWPGAWTAFVRRTLPVNVSLTRKTFSSPRPIPPLCLGMLVSLVYNRGAGMTDLSGRPERRKEMRDIRDAVAAGRLADVPAAIRAMKRLWPESKGLRDRRDREARLFEEGLL